MAKRKVVDHIPPVRVKRKEADGTESDDVERVHFLEKVCIYIDDVSFGSYNFIQLYLQIYELYLTLYVIFTKQYKIASLEDNGALRKTVNHKTYGNKEGIDQWYDTVLKHNPKTVLKCTAKKCSIGIPKCK